MRIKRILIKVLASVMIAGVFITGSSSADVKAVNDFDFYNNILLKVKDFINGITIDSKTNVPESVVREDEVFFEWDNEKRALPKKKYLFEWSYYNGVVFEGLKYIYDLTGDEAYYEYAKEYMKAMITDGELNTYAGYVSTHGLDCYKTASLLLDFVDFNSPDYASDDFYKVATTLYNDLTGTNADNYTEEGIGGNYWHSWIDGKAPEYKVWLDGLYMAQPFMTEYAYYTKDAEQLDKIVARFKWMAENMVEPGTGLYYHAANSAEDVVDFHWTRALGWHLMAMVDVMPYMEGENLETLKKIFKDAIDAVIKYQDEKTGMWANLPDEKVTSTNRLEVSGTSMIAYSLAKAVRNGWLEDADDVYMKASMKAFAGMVLGKLDSNGLEDIYFKASASGKNNYEDTRYYYTNEGKGLGPFIMAYAELLAFYNADSVKAESLMDAIEVSGQTVPDAAPVETSESTMATESIVATESTGISESDVIPEPEVTEKTETNYKGKKVTQFIIGAAAVAGVATAAVLVLKKKRSI